MAKELFPTQLFRIGNEYTRSEITSRLTNSTIGREGVINFENGLVLFVTLEKSGKPEKHPVSYTHLTLPTKRIV